MRFRASRSSVAWSLRMPKKRDVERKYPNSVEDVAGAQDEGGQKGFGGGALGTESVGMVLNDP